MPRDLFADASHARHVPRRSPWTIAGSALAHAAVLAALLVVPILAALDDFVLHADESMTFVMPTVTIPQTPPPPRHTTEPATPILDPTLAPITAPDRVTAPPLVPPGSGNSAVPDGFRVGGGPPSFGTDPGVVPLAPPPPAPVIPVRPGGDLKAPARTTYVPPVYPSLAKTARMEGSVIIEATIDETGAVRNVRVLRSQPLFDQAAIDAVTQWRYAPTRLNGVAVPVILTVTVLFTMK
jgi:protein TonB